MPVLKTKVDSELVLGFVRNNFADDVESLEFVKGGECSQAFFFTSRRRKFVIRVHYKMAGFEKDKYAYEHFNSKSIPIPKTFLLGKLNDKFYFSITERSSGKIIDEFTREEIYNLLPELAVTLGAIHNFDISNTVYFGYWDSEGKAPRMNWKNYLLLPLRDFSDDSDRGIENTIFEREVVGQILSCYEQLIDYCPNVRRLVHSDFGFNNVLSDGKKITGVIDWELSKYGDFLYDVAWLDFWDSCMGYRKFFLEHYQNKGIDVANFEERILCYKLRFGIGCLEFFAESQQENNYCWVKKELLELIK